MVTKDKPVAGAMASHISGGLDSRMVTRVSEDGKKVWLRLLTQEAGPFPASNYVFKTFD